MEHPLRRPELLVCAWRGHVAPGTELGAVGEQHDTIAIDTVDGRRIVQCLRCRSWLIVTAPSNRTDSSTSDAANEQVDVMASLVHPRRGRALREAIIMRVIAVNKAAHALGTLAVTIAALALKWNLNAIKGWSDGMLQALSTARSGGGGASTHGLFAGLLERLSHLHTHSLNVIALFAGMYTVVAATEAFGLWRERRWAEYLTALATTAFLPLEIDEILKRVTVVRIGAFVINLAILGYLVYSKHLFGFRGPIVHEPNEPLESFPAISGNDDQKSNAQ